MDTGEAFQAFVIDKTRGVLEKYIGPEISGHVRVEKQKVGYQTNCSIRLQTGLLLEAQGRGDDPYISAEDALTHLEKRVRRYKRKLKDHHTRAQHKQREKQAFITDVTVRADDESEPENTAESVAEKPAGPMIIAETARPVHNLSVSEAVMQLDLTEDTVLLFRNASTGGTNVVYRRSDGHIGWIDPGAAAVNGAAEAI